MKFCTISETARQTGVKEFRLRQWKSQGRLPGYFAGSRYYINVDLLEAMLADECRRNAGREGESS